VTIASVLQWLSPCEFFIVDSSGWISVQDLVAGINLNRFCSKRYLLIKIPNSTEIRIDVDRVGIQVIWKAKSLIGKILFSINFDSSFAQNQKNLGNPRSFNVRPSRLIKT